MRLVENTSGPWFKLSVFCKLGLNNAKLPFQLVSVCSWAACLSVPGTTVLKAPGSPAHLCSRRQAQGVVASVNGPPFNKGYMPITEAHKAVAGRWAR